MIVRILHEGQFQVKGSDLDQMNEIDNQLVNFAAEGNEEQFCARLEQLLEIVREHGQPVPLDQFVESDVILPPSGSTMEEVQHLFSGEGAIPG
jgi:hypothetical protein